MKIAVLGGSYNPVHLGHLILADCVCKELGYDKVLFVPVYNPPHKEMADAASPEDRLAMVRKAVEGDNRFEAEDFEIRKQGISYTWDTICALEDKYKGRLTDKIGLIMGQDLAVHFNLWKNADLLAEKCQLILAVRPDSYVKSTGSINKAVGGYEEEISFNPENFKCNYIKVFNPEMAISSSDIRDRIKDGRAFRYLVSDGVFNYIRDRKLYGFKND